MVCLIMGWCTTTYVTRLQHLRVRCARQCRAGKVKFAVIDVGTCNRHMKQVDGFSRVAVLQVGRVLDPAAGRHAAAELQRQRRLPAAHPGARAQHRHQAARRLPGAPPADAHGPPAGHSGLPAGVHRRHGAHGCAAPCRRRRLHVRGCSLPLQRNKEQNRPSPILALPLKWHAVTSIRCTNMRSSGALSLQMKD